jgi:hypothetical protein
VIWAILYVAMVGVVLWFGHQHELAAHAVEPRDNQSSKFPNTSHARPNRSGSEQDHA